MSRSWVRRALVAVALVAVCGGCYEQAAPPQRPPAQVVVATPEVRDVTRAFDYNGTLVAVQTVGVRARVAGYLDEKRFEDSSEVQKGDLLFVIEPAPYEHAVKQAQGELEEAQAQLALAQYNLKRTRDLMREGAAAPVELATYESEVERWQGAVKIAEASLADAKLRLEYTKVEAPISGHIDRNLVDVGNLVGSGDNTLLATVVQIDPIYAYFDASERIALLYRERFAQRGEPEEMPPAYLGLASEEGYPHAGKIDYADNQLDPATGTIRVRAVFPNPTGLLYPGMYARIRVPFDTQRDAVLIAQDAVSTDLNGKFVLVVNSENVVERRTVELGAQQPDGTVVVERGLAVGEQYIVSGLQRARPGAKVEVTTRAATRPAAGAPATAPAER